MSENPDVTQTPRKKVRVGHVIFLLVGFLICLGLAYWQWTRFQSGSGTFQNLGYALQWPVLGGCLIFFYRKYLQYENEAIELERLEAEMAKEQAAESGEVDAAARPASSVNQPPRQKPQRHEPGAITLSNRPSLVNRDNKPTEIDETFLPERPSMDVETFNELNDPHARRRRRRSS